MQWELKAKKNSKRKKIKNAVSKPNAIRARLRGHVGLLLLVLFSWFLFVFFSGVLAFWCLNVLTVYGLGFFSGDFYYHLFSI